MKKYIQKSGNIKQALAVLLFVLCCMQSVVVKAINYGHKFTYQYDNAGNRFSRTYSVMEETRKANPNLNIKDTTVLDSLFIIAQQDADTILQNQEQSDKSSLQEGELKNVYPNPTKGNIYIDFTIDYKNIQIEIWDLKGNKIDAVNTFGSNLQLDISLLSNGEYILYITTETNKKYTRKIIKL